MRLEEDQDFFTCDFCGDHYYPEPDDQGVRVLGPSAAHMSCPVCHHDMSNAALGGQRIAYCTGCGGMLIPMRIFVSLLGELRSERGSFAVPSRPLNARDLDRRIACPECGAQMDNHAYGGPGNVVLDSCETCETNWLDRGELARIAAAPDRQYAG
jgi:Zn-finger nucleic acid-binding protein